VRDAGVTTGKKREIMQEVSRFLPGYDEIEYTFALGIMRECWSLTITDLYRFFKVFLGFNLRGPDASS